MGRVHGIIKLLHNYFKGFELTAGPKPGRSRLEQSITAIDYLIHGFLVLAMCDVPVVDNQNLGL